MSGKIIQRGKITIMTYKRTDGKFEAIISDLKQKRTVKRQGDTEESTLLESDSSN